jgi:hypothetical protein
MPALSEGYQAVKERPGASPLLFGRFLMDIGAFVSLEDISADLPPYTEEVVSVPMDKPLAEAYAELEEDIAAALQEHRGNSSVISTALNALLLYPDRPVFDWIAVGRCLRRGDQAARAILDCGAARSR